MQITLEQFLGDANTIKGLLAYTYKHFDDSNNVLVDAHSFVSCIKLINDKLVLSGAGDGGAWLMQTFNIKDIKKITKTRNGKIVTYQLMVGKHSCVTLEQDF